MSGIVEDWAQQIGWPVGQRNVIVEGTIDVGFLGCAQELYNTDRGIDIFDGGFAVLAAGRGEDGGVDGVNRRLNAARQLAEVDLTSDGAQKFRFIGLYDNDEAGRRAIRQANSFDRRVVPYQDVFLLHPVMPPADGSPGSVVEERARFLNRSFDKLNWEIEDLLSKDLLLSFEKDYPSAVVRKTRRGGMTHRDFTRQGKVELIRFVKRKATLRDMMAMVRLICALRDYLGLPHNHISTGKMT